MSQTNMEHPYYITKRQMKSEFLYEVYGPEGKIGQRRSQRTYVACAGITRSEGTTAYIRNWFGRKELIGKGESARYLGNPGAFIAMLKED